MRERRSLLYRAFELLFGSGLLLWLLAPVLVAALVALWWLT